MKVLDPFPLLVGASSALPIIGTDFILDENHLGLVGLDGNANLHLFQYLLHSDGKEGEKVLRTAAAIHLGTPVRATARLFHYGGAAATTAKAKKALDKKQVLDEDCRSSRFCSKSGGRKTTSADADIKTLSA